jgi:hypothetical protein
VSHIHRLIYQSKISILFLSLLRYSEVASAFSTACTDAGAALYEFSFVSVTCAVEFDGVEIDLVSTFEPEITCVPLTTECVPFLESFCGDYVDWYASVLEVGFGAEPDFSNVACSASSGSDDCDPTLPEVSSPTPSPVSATTQSPISSPVTTPSTDLTSDENCTVARIEISTDSEPEENWNFLIGDDKRIILIPTDLDEANSTYVFEDCLTDSCFTFVHFDDGADGFENGTGSVGIAYDDELVTFITGDRFPTGFFSTFGSDCPDYVPPADLSNNTLSISIITGTNTTGLSNVIFDSGLVEDGPEYSVLLRSRTFEPETEYSLTTDAVGCVTFIMFDSLGSPDSIESINVLYDGDSFSSGPVPDGSNWLVLPLGSQC